MHFRSVLALTVFLLAAVPGARAQDSLNVTFRFLPDLGGAPSAPVVQVFLPGGFTGGPTDWGAPYVAGVGGARIANNHPSKMTFDAGLTEFRKVQRLRIGSAYQYKVQFHTNATETSPNGFTWTADPLNPVVMGNDGNSGITVTDPLVFQLAREQEGTSTVSAVSAGIFGTQAITALSFEVNGVVRDGLAFFDAGTRLFRYTLPTPVAPGGQFKVTATDALGRTATATVGTIPPAVTKAPRPAGLQDGITYYPGNPGRATLSLFAPRKQYVYALGDFNDWTPSEASLMKRDSLKADSAWYWLDVTGLQPGKEYAFQYLVDGLIRVADPYSAKVLDPFNDASIGATYPGLLPYPAGKTTGLVGVLQTAQTAFAWTDQAYARPAQKDLVIYEMILRDFIGKHDYKTLTDTLGYLQKLGINAIQLMPIAEFDGNLSWGYNSAFYFAPDKYYGPADDLKRFVNEAHRRGMAVIMDVVYNHATGQSPLVRLYNESATGDPGARALANSPYANPSARHPFNVFNDLNHDSPALRYHIDRANRWWVEQYHIDGYRFDLSKGFTQRCTTSEVACTDANFSAYTPSRIFNLKRMTNALWNVDPSAYVILEHFAEDREERELSEHRVAEGRPGMMLWTNLNRPYSEAMMGYNGGGNSNVSGAYYGAAVNGGGGRGFTVPNSVAYMESHDEQWLMFKARSYGACTNSPAGGPACNSNPGAYNVRNLPTTLDRMKAAGAFFLTLPGPKMLWEFGELGYGYGPNECLVNGDYPGECPSGTPGRVDAKPIRWEYRADADRFRLYKTWSALLKLRREQPVFSSTQTLVSLSLNGDVKRIGLRLPASEALVVIVGNFGVAPGTANPAFPVAGTWYDYFGGAPLEVTDVNALLTLKPGQFRLFTNRFIGYAEPGLAVGVERDATAGVPTELALGAGYPNPFATAATLRYGVPTTGPVVLDVYDVLGRRVAALVDGVQSAGAYVATLDGAALAPGLYVVRLTAGGETRTRTLTLVR